MDVLHLHRGVVHQHADGECQTAQRHEVQRLSAEEERDDAGEDGDGDRTADDQGRAPAAEEEEDHQRDQARCQHPFAKHLVHRGADELGLIELQLQLHAFRRRLLELREHVAGCLDD